MQEKIQEFLQYIEYYIDSITNFGWLKVLLTFIVGSVSYLMWDVTPWVIGALIIYVIDFSLGIGIAISRHDFNISRFFAWMVKLLLYFTLVVIAHQFDVVVADMINHNINALFAKYWVIWYIASHEFLSTTVKLESLWLPIPKWLVNRIRKTKDKLDDVVSE